MCVGFDNSHTSSYSSLHIILLRVLRRYVFALLCHSVHKFTFHKIQNTKNVYPKRDEAKVETANSHKHTIRTNIAQSILQRVHCSLDPLKFCAFIHKSEKKMKRNERINPRKATKIRTECAIHVNGRELWPQHRVLSHNRTAQEEKKSFSSMKLATFSLVGLFLVFPIASTHT